MITERERFDAERAKLSVEIDGLRAEKKELQEKLAHYEWRPIAEIHEDFGECILMNIEDDSVAWEIESNLDIDFDESRWTHFAEVPKLTTERALELKEALGR